MLTSQKDLGTHQRSHSHAIAADRRRAARSRGRAMRKRLCQPRNANRIDRRTDAGGDKRAPIAEPRTPKVPSASPLPPSAPPSGASPPPQRRRRRCASRRSRSPKTPTPTRRCDDAYRRAPHPSAPPARRRELTASLLDARARPPDGALNNVYGSGALAAEPPPARRRVARTLRRRLLLEGREPPAQPQRCRCGQPAADRRQQSGGASSSPPTKR